MAGFPTRETRSSFGPHLRDERRTVDPRRELSAAQMNAAFWNAGGVNICCPLVMFQLIDPSPQNGFQLAVAAWDEVIYRSFFPGLPIPPAAIPWINNISDGGTGNYQVNFASTAQDQDGNNIDIAFRFGLGQAQEQGVNDLDMVEVDLLSPTQVTVRIRNAQTGAGRDNNALVCLW